MDIRLGTLETVSVQGHEELIAQPVADALLHSLNLNEIGVVEIDASFSDTVAFSEHYQIGINQAANCIILEAKRSERTWFAACVILGNTRADVNGLVRRTLKARKISFARMEQAIAETGMEYGAITPIGLPAGWPILIDTAVINSEQIIVGSGLRKSKLVMPGKLLASLPNAEIVEGLGQIANSL